MNPLNSITYCRRVLMLGFFLSSITWVPQVYHSFSIFFSVSLPNIISVAVAPKCLFVVSNLIVIFLFGESKLGKCTKKNEQESCMTTSEKFEYFGVDRKILLYENQEETNVGIIQDNKEVEVEAVVEEKEIVEIVAKREETGAAKIREEGETVHEEMAARWDEYKMEDAYKEMENEQKVVEMREDEDNVETEHIEMEREDDEEIKGQEEEIELWAAEELNRRVEDFIAKFNKQIRLEARMAISCY